MLKAEPVILVQLGAGFRRAIFAAKMTSDPASQRDPLGWTIALALAFLALCWHRLGIPSRIYFDEVHYVPAARKLLSSATRPDAIFCTNDMMAMATIASWAWAALLASGTVGSDPWSS